MFEDIKLLRPTTLAGVPRFWNVIYSEYKKALNLALAKRVLEEEVKRVEASKGEKSAGAEGGTAQPSTGFGFVEEVEKEVKKEFKNLLGGRLHAVTTGGAPTSEAVKQFLTQCFECPVIESYGITEAGGKARPRAIAER